MKKTLKFNYDKNIGTVIYIVEGESTEFNLLKLIFCKMLKYNFIAKRRGKPDRFIDNKSVYNRVFVINSSESNISDISDKDFLDNVYEHLINEYSLDFDNAAKFYLFDRDPESNTNITQIEYYLDVLSEPYGDDTEFEKGGLLLLSYPSIESFVLSNFINDSSNLTFKLGSEVKEYIGKESNRKLIQFNKINPETLQFATHEFIKYMESINVELNLDEIKDINKSIFHAEETYFAQNNQYRVVSILILSLLYLGIIEIE